MYNIVKNAISAGGYKLAEMQHKVKKLYVLGDLTEEQLDELLAMAVGGISVSAERPETMEMIQRLSERIGVLEDLLLQKEDGEQAPDVEYEPWQAWDGISSKYQKGKVVSHNDRLWKSVFDGQNVWEPGTAGTEALWVAYTPGAEV